jgi:hypothetical protein
MQKQVMEWWMILGEVKIVTWCSFRGQFMAGSPVIYNPFKNLENSTVFINRLICCRRVNDVIKDHFPYIFVSSLQRRFKYEPNILQNQLFDSYFGTRYKVFTWLWDWKWKDKSFNDLVLVAKLEAFQNLAYTFLHVKFVYGAVQNLNDPPDSYDTRI